MKHNLGPVFAMAVYTILTFASAQAQTTETIVIALKSPEFELTETDISEVTIGQSQTIED
jgi:hypothetical protein